jgi:hypothetical protein
MIYQPRLVAADFSLRVSIAGPGTGMRIEKPEGRNIFTAPVEPRFSRRGPGQRCREQNRELEERNKNPKNETVVDKRSQFNKKP